MLVSEKRLRHGDQEALNGMSKYLRRETYTAPESAVKSYTRCRQVCMGSFADTDTADASAHLKLLATHTVKHLVDLFSCAV